MKTTTPLARSPILALDLGKYKSVACASDRGAVRATFPSITTAKDELLRLLDRYCPTLVVIEACALVRRMVNTASATRKFIRLAYCRPAVTADPLTALVLRQ